MSIITEVTQKELHDLLDIFEKKSFEASLCEAGSLEDEITKKCEHLFKQDYTLVELDNSNGVLSARYPYRIFIPEYEHGHTTSANNTPQKGTIISGSNYNTTCSYGSSSTTSTTNDTFVTFANQTMQPNRLLQHANHQAHLYYQTHHLQRTSTSNVPATNCMTSTTTNTIYEDQYDVSKIRELITMAKYARCRQRFAVPVIMYRGKYICRSATISVNAETYGRKVVDYAYDYLNGTNYSDRANPVDDENNENREDSLTNQVLNEPLPFSYEEVIKSDIQLLNALNVNTILDLMVEKRKIKYFMAVSSSEKADPENHYENFNLLSLPYPGCEFFKKFRDNNYMAKNLYYDWSQSFNDASISVPKLCPATELNINWNDYRGWDLVLMTQNYLKACLKYMQEEKSGLLIHCISGWDRTPLFISLVRLSLWADGLIHQSLNALQITYFTLAYDWYLFGHQLPDRLRRGEDIMFFCFHVLKYITDDEFIIAEPRKRTKTSSSSGGSIVNVNKSECSDDEPLKGDIILSCDQDSNDSFSNNSNCDMSLTDNSYANAAMTQVSCNPLTNRSPNAKRSKTSPITVPGAGATRQRQESTSSNGSWQVVTDTGSLDSMMNSSYLMRSLSQHPDFQASNDSGNSNCSGNNGADNTNNCSNTPSNSSNCALNSINEKNILTSAKVPSSMRKQRLNAVRAIFITAYGKTVGLKFKEGSTMNLATFIGTITDQFF